MFGMGSLQQAGTNTTRWILYVVLGPFFVGLLVWWLFQRVKAMEMEAASGTPVLKKPENRKDDLTKIEGIGPKVAKVLNDSGVTNFDSLSSANPSEIKTVLNQAGLQMMKPEGWIEQAHLAAEGDWDGLQQLQGKLKGGRRK